MKRIVLAAVVCLVLLVGLWLIGSSPSDTAAVKMLATRAAGKGDAVGNSFTGMLEFGKDIPIVQEFVGSFKQQWYKDQDGWIKDDSQKHKEQATIYLRSIRFRKTLFAGKVSANLKIGYSSWPQATWQITVRLLDSKAKSLAQASSELDTGGYLISGRIPRVSSNLSFELGRWRDFPQAKTFQITVQPASDVAQSSTDMH